MPRPALALLALVLGLNGAHAAGAVDPHMDPSLVPGSCAACHRGHGVSRSPMLPATQSDVCLRCHDSRASVDRLVAAGILSPDANPVMVGSVLAKPHSHPVTEDAFSRREDGAVTCTSCHSPHRGMPPREEGSALPGTRKLSTRDPARLEFELCQSCHGSAGLQTESPLDLSRLTNPNNPSYHPVEAPTAERSPSLLPELSGREINCTDCHGNDDPAGPRGPHGSTVAFILKATYETIDGTEESERAYALCYSCHDRALILDESPFEYHRLHVVDERSACSTCHNAHGSLENRALIRFGEETFIGGVSPSASSGILAFESMAPGEGTCFLTCHGYDHSPASYGSGESLLATPPGFADRTTPSPLPKE